MDDPGHRERGTEGRRGVGDRSLSHLCGNGQLPPGGPLLLERTGRPYPARAVVARRGTELPPEIGPPSEECDKPGRIVPENSGGPPTRSSPDDRGRHSPAAGPFGAWHRPGGRGSSHWQLAKTLARPATGGDSHCPAVPKCLCHLPRPEHCPPRKPAGTGDENVSTAGR